MKENIVVYFAGAIRGDRSMAEGMRQMVIFIQSLGVKVLSEHIIADDPISTLAEKLGKERSGLRAEDIEVQDIKWIDESTHVIAEISGASTGTGREIEYARSKHHFGKTQAKVLCLYHQDREFTASPMIRGMTPDRYSNVTIRSYEEVEEVNNIIKEFLGL